METARPSTPRAVPTCVSTTLGGAPTPPTSRQSNAGCRRSRHCRALHTLHTLHPSADGHPAPLRTSHTLHYIRYPAPSAPGAGTAGRSAVAKSVLPLDATLRRAPGGGARRPAHPNPHVQSPWDVSRAHPSRPQCRASPPPHHPTSSAWRRRSLNSGVDQVLVDHDTSCSKVSRAPSPSRAGGREVRH